ncbi:hypothetical protein [Kitasatospora sp. NPDC098663]|uniref:hypothetical protein n=1 Tax=Kitasatospora sp. NPDC098663 TaxID=3364096 RepID=UPI003823E3FA
MASTVYNQAALIASDIGDPTTARAMCRRHAAAYLHAAPLPAQAAIRALEPLVNLARLQLRAGQADQGRQHLLTLFDAVTAAEPADIEGITVPADLVADPDDRHTIRSWLWTVLLADGTRAMTAAGRWTQALTHVQTHRGIGQRMLDGRQVAVLTALTDGNSVQASELLAETRPEEPWEEAVAECLALLCRRVSGQPWCLALKGLAATYTERPIEDGMAVFDTRLGLVLLDVTASDNDPVARQVVTELHRRTMKATDGYAAREALGHPMFTALATDRQAHDCRGLLGACSLGAGTIPTDLGDRITAALHASDRVIRRSIGQQASRP